MALDIKLHQKLSQSLVMTPQLQQAIKLLQLGRTEYLEVLEGELLENPILEDTREGAGDGGESGETAHQQTIAENPRAEEEFGVASYLDLYADSYSSSHAPVRRSDTDEERPSVEASLSQPEGLTSHLLWQLRTTDLTDEEQQIALQIVYNLDKNGYLGISTEELVQVGPFTAESIERVLSVVQTFDPPGIGARDLRECLLIQLEQQGRKSTLAYTIVEHHLAKLENRRYEALAKELKVDPTEVFDAIRAIQTLEPRPGRPFVDEIPVYITPDIYVKKVGDEFVVSLNEAGMPKLRLNPRYRELLEQGKGGAAGEKEYLQEKARSAAWLIKSVHQRQQTIFKVAESIVKFQREFLEHGVSALRPLVLREVADDVGMHESTISRVTTNKYIHTPQGVYELKFFFSSGLRSAEGEVSSESVKEKIRELVSGEDPKNPLSDQALCENLQASGIDIARRTVAKYREMMNILSSSRRKKSF